jgi:hypothetical protein
MIPYSQEVLQYKNSYKNLSEVVSKTNSKFSEKYYRDAKPEKPFSLPFIPGQIYSFFYKTTSKITPERTFINRNPVVLCTESFQNKEGELILKGIDLITVPPDLRMIILERIYNSFYYNINPGSYENPKPILLNHETLKKILTDTGYSSSLFGFRTKFFGEIFTVDVKDWIMLPYLTESLIEGTNLQGIYTTYKSKLIRE